MLYFKSFSFIISIFLFSLKIDAQILDTTKIDEVIIKGRFTSETSHQKIEKIDLMKSHDIGSIFNRAAGFGIVKKGNYASEPVLHSFKYDQINLQYDGAIKIHGACPNRMDPTTVHINPKEVESAEIIKGPFSVRYGQTMGGILNIVTKTPKIIKGKKFRGIFQNSYENNGKNLDSHIQMNWIKKNYDVFLSGGIMNYGNYKSGNGTEIPSSFINYNFSGKIGIYLSESSQVRLGFHQNYSKDVLFAGLPMDADYDNSRLYNIEYKYSSSNSKIFKISAKAYGSTVDHVMSNRKRPNYSYSHAISTLKADSYGGKIETGIAANDKLILYSGIDFYHIAKDGSRNRTILVNSCNNLYYDPPINKTDLIWQNSYMGGYGVYSELNYEFNNELLFNSGARIDYSKADILSPAEDFSNLYSNSIHPKNEINYSLTATIQYLINDKLSIKLATGRGNRTPNLMERFINHLSIGSDAYEYVGNPNLTSEKNNQISISMEYLNNKLKLGGNIFYSNMRDYITARVDSSILRKFLPCKEPKYAKRFMNVDFVKQYGFESNFEYRFHKSWSIYSNLSYTYAQNISWDEPLSEIPPLASNIALRYTTKKLSTDFSVRLVAAQNRVSNSFNEKSSEKFKVFNISANYNPYNWLGINISVFNIFNENYYEHLSRAFKNMESSSMFYEPGRNIRILVKLNF